MNFLREKVSGPKNRFKEDGYNLDLTYICPRVIAMSYPASGVESVYRNPIDKVCKLIKEKHFNNFLVFNLSGRTYNYSKFDDQVLEFQWEDHHSPPIHTLFQICQKMQIFLLAKKENVCIIHCLAGKGRTGTIICCFLLYSGLIDTCEETLSYYSKKRFIQEGFGVNQPCQIRYLKYFHEILKDRLTNAIYPKLVYIKKVVFKGRPNFNTQKGCRPYFDIIYVRTKQSLLTTKKAYSDTPKFLEGDEFEIDFGTPVGICGDLLVRIKHNGYYKNQKIARISFNTAFVPDEGNPYKVLVFPLEELSPSNLLKDSRFPKNFVVEIHFGQFCQCTRYTSFKDKCSICAPQTIKEKECWDIMQRIVKNYYPLEKTDQQLKNIFKFENEQDKFGEELDNAIQKKPIDKQQNNDNTNNNIEEAKQNNNLPQVKKLNKPQNEQQNDDGDDHEEGEDEVDAFVSPVQIRKRSDVRHNFYSEDQALQPKKKQLSIIKVNTTTNNKENFKTISIIKSQLVSNSVNNPLNNTPAIINNNNNDDDNGNEDDFGLTQINNSNSNNNNQPNIIVQCKENEQNQNDVQQIENQEPPSPLSPKNAYANKKENDTDLDSPYDESQSHPHHTNSIKGLQHHSLFSKGLSKQPSNHMHFDKDSFDDLQYDSDDDPTPQKPIQGDKIFVNNMNHQ